MRRVEKKTQGKCFRHPLPSVLARVGFPLVPDGAIDCAANKRLNQPIPQATAAALIIAALTIPTATAVTADYNGLNISIIIISITAGAGTCAAAIIACATRYNIIDRAWTAERIRRGPGLDSRPAQTGLDQADWARRVERTLQIATEEPADRGKVGGCLLG